MLTSATKWFATLLLAAGTGQLVGCRSGQSPYDYSSPVADCQCESCTAGGAGRAGSVYGGAPGGQVIMQGPAQGQAMPQQTMPQQQMTPQRRATPQQGAAQQSVPQPPMPQQPSGVAQ